MFEKNKKQDAENYTKEKTASPGAELRPSVQNVNSIRPLLHAANF